jgi:Rrf2 family protein
MVLSHACNYGLRASVYLATQAERQFVSIRELSTELNISFHFLTKILQILTSNGIMASFKGPKGGVRLAKPANKIQLMDIVLAIDGDKLFTQCFLGLENCDDNHPCPIHDEWADIRKHIRTVFEGIDLETFATKASKDSIRI